MSITANKAVIWNCDEEVWNQRNLELMDGGCALAWIGHFP